MPSSPIIDLRMNLTWWPLTPKVEPSQRWTDLGGTINGLLLDESTGTLYLSSVDGNPRITGRHRRPHFLSHDQGL